VNSFSMKLRNVFFAFKGKALMLMTSLLTMYSIQQDPTDLGSGQRGPQMKRRCQRGPPTKRCCHKGHQCNAKIRRQRGVAIRTTDAMQREFSATPMVVAHQDW
jgi:hypothetical protein